MRRILKPRWTIAALMVLIAASSVPLAYQARRIRERAHARAVEDAKWARLVAEFHAIEIRISDHIADPPLRTFEFAERLVFDEETYGRRPYGCGFTTAADIQDFAPQDSSSPDVLRLRKWSGE